MTAVWAPNDKIKHVLAALTPANQLACEISLATGLRIGDVLAIRSEQLRKSGGRFTIREEKTGKSRTVRLPAALLDRALKAAGRYWLFEGRCDVKQHRTRQAVYKDLKRAARAFRLSKHVSPHSLRKIYAVEQYKKSGCNLKKVQQLLNHSDEAVTMIYALADRLT